MELVISQIETKVVEIREKSSETNMKIEVENPVVAPSPSISSLDPKIPLEWVWFIIFGNDVAYEEERDSNVEQQEDEATLGFTIFDLDANVVMKNIPYSMTPQFHGLIIEESNSFLCKFDIL